VRRSGFITTAHLAAGLLLIGACGGSLGDLGSTTTSPATTTGVTTTVAGPTTTGAPTSTTAPLPGAGLLACQVSDFGGVDDGAINQTAWAGMERAETELGVAIEFLASNDESNYRRNIDAFLDRECDLIITTGVLLAPETARAAHDNPDSSFAIIDYPVGPFPPWGDPAPTNVRGLTFQVDEAAFLAGYLAAGMSASHVIGTFGGLDIPPVTMFMEGFRRGALHYDVTHGTSTRVEGWDGEDGLFTADFTTVQEGYEAAQQLLAAGADVILPVADRVGEGACRAIEEANAAGASAMMIGKDWDWYLSAPDCAPVMLTSILKRVDVAVFKTIQNLVVIGAVGNQYLGTLENEGVGLAPFHDFEDQVPAELVAELAELAGDIAAGTVSVRG
jgi:basic membrane protein A